MNNSYTDDAHFASVERNWERHNLDQPDESSVCDDCESKRINEEAVKKLNDAKSMIQQIQCIIDKLTNLLLEEI